MYPADFDTDERVRLMRSLEKGVYLECLNHAWLNDGLPADPEDVFLLTTCTPEEFTRAWKRVEPCFPIAEDGRRRNPRQEKERKLAQSKISRTDHINASKSSRKRDVNVDENVHVNVHENKQERGTRASASVSDSFSGFVSRESAERGVEVSVAPIMGELEEIYQKAGAPIAEKHKQLAAQFLIGIEPEKRQRVANYCLWALWSGKWRDPSKTKALLNVLRDGDWDVELTPRVLPMVRAPSAKQSAVDAAEARFLGRPT